MTIFSLKLLCASKIKYENINYENNITHDCKELIEGMPRHIYLGEHRCKYQKKIFFNQLLMYGNEETVYWFLNEKCKDFVLDRTQNIEFLCRGGNSNVIQYLLENEILISKKDTRYLCERLSLFSQEDAICNLLINENENTQLQKFMVCSSLRNGHKKVYDFIKKDLGFNIKKFIQEKNYTTYFIYIHCPNEEMVMEILNLYLQKEKDDPDNYAEVFDYSLLAYRCCVETHFLKPIELLCRSGNKHFINYTRCIKTTNDSIKNFLICEFKKK